MTDATRDDPALPGRWLSFALLGIAGWTDAVGFLAFAGLYVSFMSGDATQLGVTAGGALWPGVAKFLAAQIVFIAGAAIGRVVGVRTGERHRPVLLTAIAILLLLASLRSDGTWVPAFVLAVLAMGMLNGVMHSVEGVPVGTMITGTLVRLGENVADRLSGRAAPIGENAGQWVIFVAAAALGTLAYHSLAIQALIVPATACALLAVATARDPRLRTTASNPGRSPITKGTVDDL